MLTRRRFLGTVAALAAARASRRCPVAATPVASKMSQAAFIAATEAEIRAVMLKMKRDMIRDMYADEVGYGDTVLELR